jgi:hypothetical protein
MKRFLSTLLLPIAAVALVLLVTTCVLWMNSRRNINSGQFTGLQRSFYFESSSRNGLLLRVSHLIPSITARVTGMTATPGGWAVSPSQPVTMRIGELPAGTDALSSSAIALQASPLAISRMRLQFHGFVWSSGFTTDHAVLPGPFPACQVDTFTLSFTSAAVVLALVMLIAGYFGIQARARAAEGRCPKCGSGLAANSDRCPACGTPVKAAV